MLLYTYAKTSNENLFPVKQQFLVIQRKKLFIIYELQKIKFCLQIIHVLTEYEVYFNCKLQEQVM